MDTPTPEHMGRWWGDRRLMDTPTPKHGEMVGWQEIAWISRTYGEMVGWQEIDGYANSKTYGEMVGWQEIAWISRTYGEMVGWQEIAWIRQLPNIWGDGGVAGD